MNEQSKELIVIDDNFKPLEVFSKVKGLDPIIEQIKQKVKEEDFDMSTEEGRTYIMSFAKNKIGGSKVLLQKMANALTEDWKAQTKAVRDETNRMCDEVDKIRDEITEPVKAFRQIDKDRIAKHESSLDYLRDATAYDSLSTMEQIEETIKKVNSYSSIEHEEFADRYTARMEYANDVLTIKLNSLKKAEAQAAELEKLRKEKEDRDQKDREEKLKQDAADAAKKEAEEKAAADAKAVKEAADKATKEIEYKAAKEADKAEEQRLSMMKEKEEADAKVKAAEEATAKAEKEAADAAQAERDLMAAEKKEEQEAAAIREADVKHRKKINNETLEALVNAGISDEHGKLVIQAIARNEIPHVTIQY